jgi:phosphatidylinositol glycan class M
MDRRVFLAGILLRAGFLVFGELQDVLVDVKYTDIDYYVYTDAAAKVVEGGSPYDRHTYRYSPIIAFMMIPNVVAFASWGKLVFIGFDLLAGVLLAALHPGSEKYWLLNPLVINMSTRGSSESLVASLLILTIYLLKKRSTVGAGVVFGLAVHLRIYPIIYALSIYLYTDKSSTTFFTKNRLKLAISGAATFLILVAVFYYLYGY